MHRKSKALEKKIRRKWMRIWMRYSNTGTLGKIATQIASLATPPYYARIQLSKIHNNGYISPEAEIKHTNFKRGSHVFIDDRVLIFEDLSIDANNGGNVKLGDSVHLHRDTIIQTGLGGRLIIADDTHIQPRCQINAYKSEIRIGRHVEIAPNCALYSYNHGVELGEDIGDQPIISKGGITIEDDVWLGFGVIILDGVKISTGSIIGAGSVVTSDIPENSIAAGSPAKIIKSRN